MLVFCEVVNVVRDDVVCTIAGKRIVDSGILFAPLNGSARSNVVVMGVQDSCETCALILVWRWRSVSDADTLLNLLGQKLSIRPVQVEVSECSFQQRALHTRPEGKSVDGLVFSLTISTGNPRSCLVQSLPPILSLASKINVDISVFSERVRGG